MRSKTDVTSEIRRLVQERVNAGISIRVEWFTQEILSMKCEIEGDDADFYVACAVDFIKETVKRTVGEYAPKASAATDRQIVMDGFDHMQKAYTVNRDGEQVLVPVQHLTDDEIEARAEEYEAMAKGCIAHAKELRAYRRARGAAA
ncbi:hypothetical protein [Paracoccus yeei]|uniref:hypothetical protein n=1 Tax=Paracoccus yeei TaxID=147645 RepID=UPI003BF90AEA